MIKILPSADSTQMKVQIEKGDILAVQRDPHGTPETVVVADRDMIIWLTDGATLGEFCRKRDEQRM